MAAFAASSAVAQGISVTVDGRPVAFQGQGPISVQGRVLVPLRGVLEAMGAYVEYRSASRSIYAQRGSTQLQLTLGDRNAVVNGSNVVLDVPAASMGGSTMVPLRFMGESLGADVRWVDSTRTVVINTGGGGSGGGGGGGGGNTGGSVAIQSFSHNAREWVRPGDTIDVTMVGTPGMNASFAISGVVENVSMREASAGRYQGSWTAPNNREITISGASVVGTLRSSAENRLIQAASSVSIDTVAPRITQVLPEANSRVVIGDVSVSSVFDDGSGSGIDPNTVRILVNGQDVTRDATVTNVFANLRTNKVVVGRNIVAVSARDRAGNSVNKTWEFVVADATAIIKSLSHDASGPVQAGDVITVRLEAAPNGAATFSVGQNTNLPMDENPAGVYLGRYTVRRGENLTNAPVTAKLVSGGQTFTIEAKNRISATTPTGTPPTPELTSPRAGAVDSPIVVRGTTVTNGSVKIRVRYKTHLFGAIPVTGTIYEDVIRADANGNFESESINLSDPGGEDTTYEVVVIAVGDSGKESSPKSVTVRRR
jgi:hypothetical protein